MRALAPGLQTRSRVAGLIAGLVFCHGADLAARAEPVLGHADGATPLTEVRGESQRAPPPLINDAKAMAQFLDRLMLAESGGRDDARNPRSTALGPFQFIETTFLDVVRRHFPGEAAGLSPAQILALRVNRGFARRAAEALTRDNAGQLAGAGLAATFANLRLAFLVGPGGAIRLLRAESGTPAIRILGSSVVQANPFMAGMTAGDLSAWSARNLAAPDLTGRAVQTGPSPASVTAPPRPAIKVICNRGLPSCKRWIALATRRHTKNMTPAERSRQRSR